MLRHAPLTALVWMLGALSLGCAHYDTLAIGEALTVGDGRVAPAVALEAAHGSGSSDDKGSVFTETRGRALIGPTRQQIAGLVGVSKLAWIGHRAPLWGGVGLGPALEHFSGTVFFEAVAQARIGTGFVLGESVEPERDFNPWGPEAEPWPRRPELNSRRILRKRLLLTLAVAGDADARFTRAPLYVASLMIGLALLEEPRRAP